MSKEEKDIIDFLRISAITKIEKTILSKEDVKYLLNYINKLQKEFKDLELAYGLYKDRYETLQKENEELKRKTYKAYIDDKGELKFVFDNYISKDKIRIKIKELEEKCKTIKKTYTGTYALNGNYLEAFSQIVILRELLGDE